MLTIEGQIYHQKWVAFSLFIVLHESIPRTNHTLGKTGNSLSFSDIHLMLITKIKMNKWLLIIIWTIHIYFNGANLI